MLVALVPFPNGTKRYQSDQDYLTCQTYQNPKIEGIRVVTFEPMRNMYDFSYSLLVSSLASTKKVPGRYSY
jgi:hypothetical protein